MSQRRALLRSAGSAAMLMAATRLDAAAATCPAGDVFNVNDYRVNGNSDAQAIQTAMDAAANTPTRSGVVQFPNATYHVTAPLNLCRPDSAPICVSLQGNSAVGTRIQWEGGASGTLLRVIENKRFQVDNLSLENNSGSRGSTVGVLLSNNVAGTGTLGSAWETVIIGGFSVAVQLGETNGNAASEHLFSLMTIHDCDSGVVCGSFNTYDNHWILPIVYNCGVAFDFGIGQHHVWGGSLAGNAIDFRISNFGTYWLSAVRSEEVGSRFLVIPASGPVNVHAVACKVTNVLSPDGYAVESRGAYLTMEDNQIEGRVLVTKPWGHTRMFNNGIGGPGITTAPYAFEANSGANGHRYHCESNYNYAAEANGPATLFADETGYILNGVRVPSIRLQQGTADDASGPPAQIQLGAARDLLGFYGHAPAGRAIAPPAATNLASAITLVNAMRAALQASGWLG